MVKQHQLINCIFDGGKEWSVKNRNCVVRHGDCVCYDYNISNPPGTSTNTYRQVDKCIIIVMALFFCWSSCPLLYLFSWATGYRSNQITSSLVTPFLCSAWRQWDSNIFKTPTRSNWNRIKLKMKFILKSFLCIYKNLSLLTFYGIVRYLVWMT